MTSPGQGFWSITGYSADQAGSSMLHGCPKQLLPWPPSNPDKLLRQTNTHSVATGRFQYFKGRFTHSCCQHCSIPPFPTVKSGQDEAVSLSFPFTNTPLIFVPKALQSTLKKGMKEHKQTGEGQMEIKGVQSNEDKIK